MHPTNEYAHKEMVKGKFFLQNWLTLYMSLLTADPNSQSSQYSTLDRLRKALINLELFEQHLIIIFKKGNF